MEPEKGHEQPGPCIRAEDERLEIKPEESLAVDTSTQSAVANRFHYTESHRPKEFTDSDLARSLTYVPSDVNSSGINNLT